MNFKWYQLQKDFIWISIKSSIMFNMYPLDKFTQHYMYIKNTHQPNEESKWRSLIITVWNGQENTQWFQTYWNFWRKSWTKNSPKLLLCNSIEWHINDTRSPICRLLENKYILMLWKSWMQLLATQETLNEGVKIKIWILIICLPNWKNAMYMIWKNRHYQK